MIKNQNKIILILIVGLIINTLNAISGDDAGTIIKKLQKKYDGIRDASVTFSQHVQFGVTKSEQTFSGKFSMKKGNKYRIEMDQQTIITDGKSVWSFNKINNQVLIDKYKEDPKSFSPDKVLVNVPGNYNSVLLGIEKSGEQEVSILKLTPKNEKLNLKWMKIWVDNDDWLMKKIQILDISDNLMTYTLNEIKINPDIPDSAFQFVVPDSINVIDLR
jgi:chaperone LolA